MTVEDFMNIEKSMQECGLEVLQSVYTQDVFKGEVREYFFVFITGKTQFDLCLFMDGYNTNLIAYNGDKDVNKQLSPLLWPIHKNEFDGICSDDLGSLVKGRESVELNSDLFQKIKRMI